MATMKPGEAKAQEKRMGLLQAQMEGVLLNGVVNAAARRASAAR